MTPTRTVYPPTRSKRESGPIPAQIRGDTKLDTRPDKLGAGGIAFSLYREHFRIY